MDKLLGNLSKPKKILLLLAAAVILIGLIILIANACMPQPFSDEIIEEIIQHNEAAMQKIREAYGYDALTLEIEIDHIEVARKATIFEKGKIVVHMTDYLVSTQFEDLESGEYNSDTYSKYIFLRSYADDKLQYYLDDLEHYTISVKRVGDEQQPRFKDSQGNRYWMPFNNLEYDQIYKNGELVLNVKRESVLYSNSSSSGSKVCKKCGKSASNLTAGGYCKTCVDTYYTDYYIGLDGEVHADRPY